MASQSYLLGTELQESYSYSGLANVAHKAGHRRPGLNPTISCIGALLCEMDAVARSWNVWLDVLVTGEDVAIEGFPES